MTNIGLYRTNRAELFFLGIALINLIQRHHLNRITQFRAGAVGFNVLNAFRMNASHTQNFLYDLGLAFYTWCIKTSFIRTVIVDCDATHQSVDVITVADGIKYLFNHHDGHALTSDQTIGSGVKGFTMTITRKIHAWLIHMASPSNRK